MTYIRVISEVDFGKYLISIKVVIEHFHRLGALTAMLPDFLNLATSLLFLLVILIRLSGCCKQNHRYILVCDRIGHLWLQHQRSTLLHSEMHVHQ